MQEKAKEPEIRFAGFTGAWEQRKVKDLAANTYGGGTPSTSNPEFWEGSIPWIQSSDLSEHNLFRVHPRKFISQAAVANSPVKIIPENSIAVITRVGVGKLAVMSFSYTTSQDFLSLGNLNTDVKFASYQLYRRLQKDLNAVQGTSIKGITKEELLGKNIDIPGRQEQEAIGKFFSKIDSLLTLHQRKYEKLLNIKKSMLEKMFPKEGEVVPEIRFKGFTGAWEQRVLGDFLEVSMETNSSAKFDKNDVLSISGDYGVVNQIAFQGRSFASNSVVKYGVLHNEDIVYTKSPLKANPYGIIKTNKGKAGIVSPLYAIYHPKNNLVPSFVQSYFEQNERLNNYLRPLVNKGAKNNMLISNEKAISGKVIFPSRKEQEKISALLERVDSLLTLHQRKLEMLKNVKQAFLEKMFV